MVYEALERAEVNGYLMWDESIEAVTIDLMDKDVTFESMAFDDVYAAVKMALNSHKVITKNDHGIKRTT